MPLIDKITIDKIKEAANIVDIVGDFVELQKSGADYEGLCPFHDDRHVGSFKVNERRNICSCFSCGARYKPLDFLMNVRGGMSYRDALLYCASKYGIYVEGEKPIEIKKATPRKPAPKLPVKYWPIDMAKAKMSTDNNLCKWLHTLNWNDEDSYMLDEWLKLYAVGTSTNGWTNGWTIFWQIDDQMRVRDGKLMAYAQDGHRDKDKIIRRDGKQMDKVSWISSLMKYAGMFNPKEADIERCLFGLHLICLDHTEICIVESEKSAIICQTLSMPGKALYMATGSKGNLTRHILEPLIEKNEKIVLIPDHDAYDDWVQKSKLMDYPHIQVSKIVEQNWIEADGPKADIADIMIRKLQTPVRTKLDIMKERHPIINEFINKFNLYI